MLTVLIGGSGSGKSELAEDYVLGLKEKVNYYIATMHPWGAEGRKRVERHRSLRSGKPFQTVECFRNVGSLVLPEKGAVLLECLSNLVANELFDEPGPEGTEWYVKKLSEDLEKLERQCRHLVIVTNDLFADGICYEEQTMQYLEVLGRLNRYLGCRADLLIEAAAGRPDVRKRAKKTEITCGEEGPCAF